MTACALKLDQRGESFVIDELKSANTFGQNLCQFLDFSKGRFFAVVPDPARGDPYAFHTSICVPAAAHRFPVPGGYVQEVQSTESAVTGWLSALLAGDPNFVLVSESYLLRATDVPLSTELPKRTTTCGDFVYHLSFHGDPHSELEAVVRMMYPVPLGLGALVSVGSERMLALTRCTQLDSSDLRQFAQQARAIFVGAYDGESVIAWVNNELEMNLPSCSSTSR